MNRRISILIIMILVLVLSIAEGNTRSAWTKSAVEGSSMTEPSNALSAIDARKTIVANRDGGAQRQEWIRTSATNWLAMKSSYPAVGTTIASQQDEPDEWHLYVPDSKLYPNGITVAAPGAPPSICGGNFTVTNDSVGLSWGLINALDGLLIINIPFDQGHDITNPSYVGLSYYCNDPPSLAYRIRVYVVDPVGPVRPVRGKFFIRTKSAVLGVRG